MYQGSLPATSNREDFEAIFQLVDEDTGDLIDLTSASIEFDISEPGCTPRLTATTDNGKITLVETTTFRVAFSRSEMSCLCAGQYDVGSTVENGGTTRSFIIGTLPVLDGRVSR
jgi:hypothetical protein